MDSGEEDEVRDAAKGGRQDGGPTDGRLGASSARGTVKIAPAVLIELIELTVQDIGGVAGLRSRRNKRPADSSDGARTYDSGKIAVTVHGDQIDAAVSFAMYRGTNVSELGAEIQRRIGFAAGNMLGMTVRTVDMYIEEIVPALAPS